MRRNTLLTNCLLAGLLTCGAALAQAPAASAVAPAKVAKKGAPGPKSKPEAEAVNAVILAQSKSPDEMIAAADALVSKFADTIYKSFALELEAEAYQKKNDNTKAIIYGEQALAADAKNYDADNLLANVTVAITKDTDLDKEEKLARAEKYAHESLDTLEKDGKPELFSNLTDEQWKSTKDNAESLAYQALGNVALTRKKTDEAVANYQKGLELNPDPILMIRAGRALLAARKYDDAIGYFDKAMNAPNVAPQIKSIAEADRARTLQAKPSAK